MKKLLTKICPDEFDNDKQNRQDYIKETTILYNKNTFRGIILALIVNHTCNSLDYFVYPDYFYILFIIRIIFSLTLLSLFPFLKKNTTDLSYNKRISFIWGSLMTFFISLMIYLIEGAISPYYVGLILIITGYCQFSPSTALDSTKFCLIVICFYLAAITAHHLQYATPFDFKIFYNNFLFLILTASINVISCYFGTSLKIKEFKQRCEIKTMESQLVQDEKLKSLGILAAGIIHEINNPLSIMKGSIKILEKRISRNINEKDKIIIERIKDGISRMSKITDNLRRFASGKKSDKEYFSLYETLKSARLLVSKKIEHIKVNNKIKPDGELVIGSPSEITQVFINLFTNAERALRNIDRKPIIEISSYKYRNRIFIKFRDNGHGIDDSTLPNIFDPFFTTKKSNTGMGLGLSIAYKIINNHGGNLEVKTKKNEFTEFIFDLLLKKSRSS